MIETAEKDKLIIVIMKLIDLKEHQYFLISFAIACVFQQISKDYVF